GTHAADRLPPIPDPWPHEPRRGTSALPLLRIACHPVRRRTPSRNLPLDRKPNLLSAPRVRVVDHPALGEPFVIQQYVQTRPFPAAHAVQLLVGEAIHDRVQPRHVFLV